MNPFEFLDDHTLPKLESLGYPKILQYFWAQVSRDTGLARNSLNPEKFSSYTEAASWACSCSRKKCDDLCLCVEFFAFY